MTKGIGRFHFIHTSRADEEIEIVDGSLTCHDEISFLLSDDLVDNCHGDPYMAETAAGYVVSVVDITLYRFLCGDDVILPL